MGGRKRSRSKLRFSKIYTFACGTSSFREDHLRIGDSGFSYKAYINDSDNFAENIEYGSNYVYTTKYSLANFFPKALFEQFRRVANLYFLLSAVLSFTPVSPFMPMSFVLPLVIVIGATMAKEAVEDWRRFQQDNEVNNRKVQVRLVDGTFNNVEWKNVRVGDIVRVEKDNFFPADLLLLSSSYEDAICYVETMNLDGETNLKLKQALEVTSKFHDDSDFTSFTSVVRCEDPNANLYSFVGTMDYSDVQYPLSPQQLLLRDSKLRNTEYIFGAVIFNGHDTKVMQNATEPPSKRSTIEKRMDKIIYFLFSLLVLISAIGSVIFSRVMVVEDRGSSKRWYLRPDRTNVYFDPQRATLAAFFHFLTAMMVYGYFIPISLYISVEIVKILQSMFINQDISMYYENTDMPAHARTSNLNEELGQVDTILSDKTGTLTSNSLEFIKCSIAGTAYGIGVTEVERAMSRKRRALLFNEPDVQDQGNNNINRIKGFNFEDDRLTGGNWVHERHSNVIRMFFRTLATCHTAIPEVDDDSGKTSYEAESPDEAAFVIAAREFGFEFYKRNQSSIKTSELDPDSRKKIKRTYKILNTLDFSSMRRRMSVVIRDEGKLLLVSKGADSVMFERLAVTGRMFEEETREHINQYADAGLRTLVIAYRELSEEEYNNFNKIFLEAKNSITADRDEKLEAAAELIEKDLILLGATAVEDKLQIGVPECIDKLAQAGIKIWVLTGDKMETAVNIGFACSLLRQGMKQIIISLDGPEISSLEKEGTKDVITKESRAHVTKQITKGKSELGSSSNEVFALIIDGKSLAFALENELKDTFLALAIGCASVICCRSSPKQKALVTRLVKMGVGKTTLAIGDGANDVGMLQEADIGIGISGVEGQQAVMASDVAIAQFRFLERLLLVHGHWCYRRIASMICYFFYKNIALGFTLFIFEGYTSFSGQAAYNEWYMALYNTLFTSLPAIALGVFDQDVSARYCLKFPQLYQQGVQNLLFRWVRILVWIFNGVLNSLTIFFFCATALESQAFRKSGETADYQILGTMMFTVVVWVVNCQMALFVRYFTLIQHIFIWGGIALWYVFLLVYGSITPTTSTTTAFMVFLEELSPSVSFWVVKFFVVIVTLLPYFSYSAIQIRFFPMYHEKIQWLRLRGQPEELGHSIRDNSFRETSVGFTARVEAIANQIGGPEADATHTR